MAGSRIVFHQKKKMGLEFNKVDKIMDVTA